MWRHVSLVSLIVLLAACGSSPKTEFYVLNADFESIAQTANANTGPAVGVWGVQLPGFLERSEIVTRDSEFEVILGDFAWWADDLSENMTRLIAAELTLGLQSNQITVSPWPSYFTTDFQTVIHVERFDGVLGGETVLRGVWSLLDANGQKELRREVFEFSESAAGSSTEGADSYKEMVATLSRLTVQLAEQMTKGILEQQSM